MKFQNISMHGSKIMLCTRKHDEQANEQSNEWTDKPEVICPPPPPHQPAFPNYAHLCKLKHCANTNADADRCQQLDDNISSPGI